MSSATNNDSPPTLLLRLPNQPSLVECRGLRFLIMDAPTDANLALYLKASHVFS